MTNNVNLSKAVTYAVAQIDPSARVSKAVTYAVQQTIGAKLSKAVPYGVSQLNYGTLYQDESSKRPVYREAPAGGIPYVDMSAIDAELKVGVPYDGTYTFIIYNADETFTVVEEELTAGENVAPITEDFNQCAVILNPNAGLHRFAIESIKEGMKARAN